MISIQKKFKKIISSVLIVSVILPSFLFLSMPKKSEAAGWPVIDIITNINTGIGSASTTVNTGISIKNVAKEIFRQFLMLTARRLLAKLTQNTINWVNSGFHGNPLYLENPGSFFKDIAKYEIRALANIYGYDSVRFPFGREWALDVINAYQYQAEDNASYTLSKVINDPVLLRGYQNDFNVGGWNGFLINTQYPQNNYIGFRMIANETLANKLAGTTQNNAQKVQTTLQQGLGFLSPKTCPTNPNYNNGKNEFKQPSFDLDKFDKDYRKIDPPPPMYLSGNLETGEGEPNPEYTYWEQNYQNYLKPAMARFNEDNTCPGGLVATTPGSIVGNQVAKALGSKQDSTTLAAAMGNSVAAILDTLINHFMSKGLNALSNKINPNDDSNLRSGVNQGDFKDPLTGETINGVLNTNDGSNYVNPYSTEGGAAPIPGREGWCATQESTDSFGNKIPGQEFFCGATPNTSPSATCEEKCTAAGAVGIDVQSCIAMSCNGQTSNTNANTGDNDPANTYNPLTNPYFDPYAQQQ